MPDLGWVRCKVDRFGYLSSLVKDLCIDMIHWPCRVETLIKLRSFVHRYILLCKVLIRRSYHAVIEHTAFILDSLWKSRNIFAMASSSCLNLKMSVLTHFHHANLVNVHRFGNLGSMVALTHFYRGRTWDLNFIGLLHIQSTNLQRLQLLLFDLPDDVL